MILDTAVLLQSVEMAQRLGRAMRYTPQMIVELQDALMHRMQDELIASGSLVRAAEIKARVNFDAWEHDAFSRLGSKSPDIEPGDGQSRL